MQNSLISRTGRLLSSLLRAVSHARSFRCNGIAGGIFRLVRMMLQVMVLWPAFIAGFVLVMTFLVLKMNGNADAQWLRTLEMQAAAYQGAPQGDVLSSRCHIDRETSPSADGRPVFPDPGDNIRCPSHPVTLMKVAQDDIAVLTSIYMTLVTLSLLWLLWSEMVLPLATRRHQSGEMSGRSARSYVTYRGGNIVIRTPDGGCRAVLTRRDKEGEGEGGTDSAGGGRNE
uniref:hypothetical protein n=1 Tax=Scandinavium goeteborgense TaxID=1851514 RepID=UPI0013575866|nr:hypothetical protein [Scandinavium goeteborgense]